MKTSKRLLSRSIWILLAGLCLGAQCSHADALPLPAPQPTSSLTKLLDRIDKAPIDWGTWGKVAKQGDEMAAAAQQVASVTHPLAPYLEKVAKNPALTSTSNVPLLGHASQSVQNTLTLLSAIDSDFASLVEADANHNGPLRAAAQAGARLQHSRSPQDAPAVATSFDAAGNVLNGDTERIMALRQKIAILDSALTLITPLAEQNAPSYARRFLALRQGHACLQSAKNALDFRAGQLGDTAQWLQDGAREARDVK